MPCHTAYHASDSYEYRVSAIRKEVPTMLHMIRRICAQQSWKSFMAEPQLYGRIERMMLANPNLTLVSIRGLNNAVHDPDVKEKVERLSYAACWYGALSDKVTAELCRICQQAENTPGKILLTRELAWWNKHRNNAGHDSSSAVEVT